MNAAYGAKKLIANSKNINADETFINLLESGLNTLEARN